MVIQGVPGRVAESLGQSAGTPIFGAEVIENLPMKYRFMRHFLPRKKDA
jgi:hypothetical protein